MLNPNTPWSERIHYSADRKAILLTEDGNPVRIFSELFMAISYTISHYAADKQEAATTLWQKQVWKSGMFGETYKLTEVSLSLHSISPVVKEFWELSSTGGKVHSSYRPYSTNIRAAVANALFHLGIKIDGTDKPFEKPYEDLCKRMLVEEDTNSFDIETTYEGKPAKATLHRRSF